MPTSTLKNFILTVPSCLRTSRLKVALEIFAQRQCDRLVVVSEQQCPVGVLHLAQLIPELMAVAKNPGGSLIEHKLLSTFGQTLIRPMVTLPAHIRVDQLGIYLRSQLLQLEADSDWALVGPTGQFLGLLDSQRLLKFLLLASPTAEESGKQGYEAEVLQRGLSFLVQLLQKLPWPLMLQTSEGKVISQNPAWGQQFGTNSLDSVRREVEALLEICLPEQVEGRSPALEVKNQLSVPRSHGLEVGTAPLNSVLSVSVLGEEVPSLGEQSGTTDSTLFANRCQVGTQPNTCVCAWISPNGQERVWQFVKIPLQELPVGSNQVDQGEIWLLLAQDVSERRQLCKELAAKNADLIQLNRLKDEFLACISHELKTPLTAVLGLSSLLKDQLLGELNERQARYARLIHESGRHLMTVVNDILDLTRMETGQMELTLEPVPIAAVCERAVQQAREIQPKGSDSPSENQSLAEYPIDNHDFTLFIEPGLESLVADAFRLRQMLVHLLSNAFKFTQLGGEIGLRVSYWEGWIAFTVWDTGIGIPEHKQHLIFQKFQQLENPLTRQFEGTGLGLVLTRALARLHGGDVSFISQEGKGSQFTLLLPPSPPPQGAGEQGGEFIPTSYALLPTPQNHRNRLVLVVEAAPQFIDRLSEQLTSLGYRVVIARSGTEALEKARRLQPKAIFLNPLLPLLSGWDVLTLLKSDEMTSQIPVIVTATQAEKDQALASRADDFLSLPIQEQSLQQVLFRFCAISSVTQSSSSISINSHRQMPLTILYLSAAEKQTSFNYRDNAPITLNYRVLEAEDLDQAALVARIWQPDVVLLARDIADPLGYLQRLCEYQSLAKLPLVTLDVAITQAANQVTGLSVFPCLASTQDLQSDTLWSVLQIAAGMSCKPSLLIVDIATLPDLQGVKSEELATEPSLPKAGFRQEASTKLTSHASPSGRSEWFQALIQYLQTAGFRGVMARSWGEVMQQIRATSVDLLLISLSDTKLNSEALAQLIALSQQDGVPPILFLDQRLHQGQDREECGDYLQLSTTEPSTEISVYPTIPLETEAHQTLPLPLDTLESPEGVLLKIATQVLPASLSMAELLTEINHTLALKAKDNF